MSRHLKLHLLQFLKKHLKKEKSFLLGLSGGNDSLALFYLLLECKKDYPFTLGVAHIDHNWREESSREAALLNDLSAMHSLPFHLKKLDIDSKTPNIEAICRDERMAFFYAICQKEGYQAVMLAHHLDDKAETVLKNIFEGANICSCNGIGEQMHIGSLTIWRPLLPFTKSQLSTLIAAGGYLPFTDATNLDPRFLRGRMRSTLIPHLEAQFGKNIRTSLASLGQESQELHAFMHRHLASVLASIHSTEEGSSIDISPFDQLGLFEIKFIIRHLCRIEKCVPSKLIVHQAALKLIEKKANKQFMMGSQRLLVNRSSLFLSKERLRPNPDSVTKELVNLL